MSDTLSSLLKIVLQETGGNEDIWGEILNEQLEALEDAVAGIETVVVTNGTVTLTDEQSRAAIMTLSGTLTDNVVVEVPARSKTWIVRNLTTQGPSFTVSLKVAGIVGNTLIPSGTSKQYVCTGTTIETFVSAGGVAIGAVIDFATATVPGDYLECNGAAISRTTYSALFAAIGGLWGAGDGSTTFNLPDARDKYRRGKSASYPTVGASLAQDIQSHTHSASLTGADHVHGVGVTLSSIGDHTHTYSRPIPSVSSPGGTPGFFYQESSAYSTDPAGGHTHSATVTETPAGAGSISGSIGSTGGTETRPASIVVLTCIRYQ
jgi:microcystin-dependent protein